MFTDENQIINLADDSLLKKGAYWKNSKLGQFSGLLIKMVMQIIVYGPYKRVWNSDTHYNDVIMGAMASQITSLTSIYSSVYSGSNQSKI